MHETPVWCAKCHLRVAPYELRIVHYKTTYHQHCFLLLVREKADQDEKVKQAEVTGAKHLGLGLYELYLRTGLLPLILRTLLISECRKEDSNLHALAGTRT